MRPARRPQPPKRPAESSGRTVHLPVVAEHRTTSQYRCSLSRTPLPSALTPACRAGGSPSPPLKMRGEIAVRSCASTERTTMCVSREVPLAPARRAATSADRSRLPSGVSSSGMPTVGVPLRELAGFLKRAMAALAASVLSNSDRAPSQVASSTDKCFHLTKYSMSCRAPRESSTSSTSYLSCRRASSPSAMLSDMSPTCSALPPTTASLPAPRLRRSHDCTAGHCCTRRRWSLPARPESLYVARSMAIM
mmetsp:Transcript_6383/g.16034  ORF Transcript_6383/g.16034 Transcript_6383/m.16034 type:complete len:250 (-) Transcript_6383:1298-2047(-)